MHSLESSTCGQILDIFIEIRADRPGDQLMSAPTVQITAISLRVHDSPRFTETRFEEADEPQLLRQFWLFITQSDFFIHPRVKYEAAFIRLRTAALGLVPALMVETRNNQIYGSMRENSPERLPTVSAGGEKDDAAD